MVIIASLYRIRQHGSETYGLVRETDRKDLRHTVAVGPMSQDEIRDLQ